MAEDRDRAVVDRIVDGWAVLLVGADEAEHQLSAESLPAEVAEGDWLHVRTTAGGGLEVVGVDHAGAAVRRDALRDRLARLRHSRGGGRFRRERDC